MYDYFFHWNKIDLGIVAYRLYKHEILFKLVLKNDEASMSRKNTNGTFSCQGVSENCFYTKFCYFTPTHSAGHCQSRIQIKFQS